MKKGKVLIIDDSIVVQKYLTSIITECDDLELVGTALNGEVGFQQILETQPDVVVLDLIMNNGDGLYVLQEIEKHFEEHLRPFIILYSTRAFPGDPVFTKAIDFGFCDFILKTTNTDENFFTQLKHRFIPKIKNGIEAKKNRILLHQLGSTINTNSVTPEKHPSSSIPEGISNLPQVLKHKYIQPKLLVIGASTGGPQVVRSIINSLNSSLSIPVAIIQHMPESFTSSFAEELNNTSDVNVYELRHNTIMKPGNVYLFPGGMHGKINSFGNILVYYSEKKDYEHHPFKPSINLAMDTLLNSFQYHAIFCMLSGMGTDGGSSTKKLHDRGSLVVVQDEMSSAVWGMPKAVIKQKAADIILSHQDLKTGIRDILKYYQVMD